MSKLFDDASLAMIPSAYKDGKLYSIRPIPEYGAELVTNGGFDTDSDWIKGTNWAISSGSLNATSATDKCEQNTSVTTNKTYLVSYNITNYVSGSVRIELSSGNVSVGATNSGNGFYSEEITALGDGYVLIDAMVTFTGSIDNVSVKEVLKPSGDFTFSRGSNLAATRVDVNGLIEKGRENLLLQSNQFDTTWAGNNALAISGYADRNGGTNAWLLREQAGNIQHYIRQSSGLYSGIGTFSFYAKKKDYDWIQFARSGDGGDYANFNISNGTLGNVSGASIIDRKIESVGNGWYRCSVTYSFGSNSFVGIALIRSDVSTRYEVYQGDNTSGTYIQDAQVELGLVATDYIETGTSAAQSGILEDMPRLDYSGGASCPSLLLEPQRTNVVKQSEYFESSEWIDQSIDTALELVSSGSPDGNAFYRCTSGASGGGRIVDVFTGSMSGGVFSLYAKGSGSLMIDLFITGGSNVTETITLTSEWTRYDVYNSRVDSGGDASIRFYPNAVADIYGAQIESGSYPTSYIPTYGTSQTRSADDCVSSNIDGLIGDNQGTLFVQGFGQYITGADNHLISLSSLAGGSGTDRVLIYTNNTTGNLQVYINSGGLPQYGAPINLGVQGTDANDKIAVAFADNDLSVYVNGSKVGSSTSGTAPTMFYLAFNEWVGNHQNTSQYKQAAIFPTRLTDAELAALTTL